MYCARHLVPIATAVKIDVSQLTTTARKSNVSEQISFLNRGGFTSLLSKLYGR